MVNIPWFIPQNRYVNESYEEVQKGFNIKRAQDLNEKKNRVKELRDEANRPWYKFFDESEYSFTDEEKKAHKWWQWFETGTSPEEKKLLWKLDLLIACSAFVGYWAKNLDLINITNAYVSGMKENLNLGGNDLINLQVIFSVGNIVLDLPFFYILPRYNTTYILFLTELGWGIFTLAQARAPNIKALKAFRFLVGAFEAAYFPAIHHTMANWYKPTEITRRAGFFYFGSYLGNLTSGLLQGSIYRSLDGKNGLEGWRWMFIIDGCISFAVAILTVITIPGTPFDCYSIWLTDEEIKLARRRMRSVGLDYKIPTTKQFFDTKMWKGIITSWHFWIFTFANIGGWNSTGTSSGSFALWLKSLNRYSVSKLNDLTSTPSALGIAYVLIACWGTDILRQRFLTVAFCQILNIVGLAILAVWDVPEGAKWFAFMLGYWCWAQSSIIYSLQNSVLRRNANTRAIEWLATYIIGYQSSAWISRLLFPTTDSPRYHKGFTGAACFSGLQILSVILGLWFYKRDEKRNAHENGIIVYDSSKGETPEEVLSNLVWEEDLTDDEKETEKVFETTKTNDDFLISESKGANPQISINSTE